MTIYGVHSSSFKRFLNGVSESVVGKFLSRDLDAIAFMQEMERVTISLGVGGGSAHLQAVSVHAVGCLFVARSVLAVGLWMFSSASVEDSIDGLVWSRDLNAVSVILTVDGLCHQEWFENGISHWRNNGVVAGISGVVLVWVFVISNNSVGVSAVLNLSTLGVVVVEVLRLLFNRLSRLSGFSTSNKAVQVLEVGAFSSNTGTGGTLDVVAHGGDDLVWSSDLLALLWMMSLEVHSDIGSNFFTGGIMGGSISTSPSVVI